MRRYLEAHAILSRPSSVAVTMRQCSWLKDTWLLDTASFGHSGRVAWARSISFNTRDYLDKTR